ncbi:hypothetical protein [Streptomyces profundus]|uniref:hypothetical protein n=1 Tax=Streptomyces profundus TaxID=2867410 RepID=UPI001D160BB8|nr:hypothetical protein [Streptomyces sp. MA3_2.13]UED85796.1 hypothetical protein K4G22_17670 [Streptomyces sp. MA3_2.13]
MEDGAGLRVPVGRDARRWATRADCHRVLLVVHNVTSATRLLDVLPLMADDLRVQMLATCTGSSPFLAGMPELLSSLGLPVLPWEQAKATPVDLAISASYGGRLDLIQGDLAVLSHGVGYNKRLATPEGGPSDAAAPVFGLSPDWLLHRGRPLATATVLSHPEQLDRLSAACPEAAPTAVLAGDPCYDRILEARPHRARFRRALGVTPEQRLVVVSSTWSPRSLFGDERTDHDELLPWLLRGLTTELPADEYRTAAVLHPNIWYGHGPGQLRAWLDRARRAGLTLIDPLDGWRQALIAADCVVGDHSSVTSYAAAIGTPVLLGAFPEADLDPDSPVAALGRAAPRLRPRGSLRAQLDRAIDEHRPGSYAELAGHVSSAPGESAPLLRRLFYRLIGLPEPDDRPARLDRLRTPSFEPAERTAPVRALTRLISEAPLEIAVTRYPDTDFEPEMGGARTATDDAHTVVHEDTQDASRLALADVILRYAAADDPRYGPPATWTAEVLARYGSCALAAYVSGPDRCTVRTRDGALYQLTAAPDPDGHADLCDPAVYASAVRAWLDLGHAPAGRRPTLLVTTGPTRHRVTVEPLPKLP